MRRSTTTQGGDFLRVAITPDEMEEWRSRYPRRPNGPGVYRVKCIACEKRLWGSGLGIGAHRKSCPGKDA